MSQDDINASFHKRLKRLEKGTDMVTEDSTPPQSHLEPSSSLHTKLQTILSSSFIRINGEKYFLFSEPEYSDPVIAQILQAFKSEGWLTPEDKEKVMSMVNQMANIAKDMTMGPPLLRLDTKKGKVEGVMTGQEFYDRFKAELDKQPTISSDDGKGEALITLTNVYKALHVAAGIA